MAGLKVFISPTCYDMGILRGELRTFIKSMGYIPIMSDYNDILFDPRIHTHTSCINEVKTCDMIILIVGSRFGGKAVPEAIKNIDFDKIKNTDCFKKNEEYEGISITQLEILKAVESSIPVYTFIDSNVSHDHHLFLKNKEKKFIDNIEFPSIEKQETAKYIFEFINFLKHRTKGNSIFEFSEISDIQENLKKQWSSYFQRLLKEQFIKDENKKQFDFFTEQFEDLKTALITSNTKNGNEREIARGVIRYRKLYDFVNTLHIKFDEILAFKGNFKELLEHAQIVNIVNAEDLESLSSKESYFSRRSSLLIKDDKTYYICRFPSEYIRNMAQEWEIFSKLEEKNKKIILEALDENFTHSQILRYKNRDITMDYNYSSSDSDDCINSLMLELG